jgi:hypothetical protein
MECTVDFLLSKSNGPHSMVLQFLEEGFDDVANRVNALVKHKKITLIELKPLSKRYLVFTFKK